MTPRTRTGVPLQLSRFYRRIWNPNQHAEIFGGKFRLYIPFNAARDEQTPEVPPAITSIVKKAGYAIHDYVAGLAVKDDDLKRKVRIGTLLSHDKEIQNLFANDPTRSAHRKKLLICISRHPHDIIGMSYNRGWSSCMHIIDGGYRDVLEFDVRRGTLVAYLIEERDRNIHRPLGRITIKPFRDIEKPDDRMVWDVESRAYGTVPTNFRDEVKRWVEVNLPTTLEGIFKFDECLYRDAGTPRYRVNNGGRRPRGGWAALIKSGHGEVLGLLPNIPLTAQINLARFDLSALYKVENLNRDFKLLLVRKVPHAYHDLHPMVRDQETVLAAFTLDPSVIGSIHNPTEEHYKSAVCREPYYIFEVSKKFRTDGVKMAFVQGLITTKQYHHLYYFQEDLNIEQQKKLIEGSNGEALGDMRGKSWFAESVAEWWQEKISAAPQRSALNAGIRREAPAYEGS